MWLVVSGGRPVSLSLSPSPTPPLPTQTTAQTRKPEGGEEGTAAPGSPTCRTNVRSLRPYLLGKGSAVPPREVFILASAMCSAQSIVAPPPHRTFPSMSAQPSQSPTSPSLPPSLVSVRWTPHPSVESRRRRSFVSLGIAETASEPVGSFKRNKRCCDCQGPRSCVGDR